ncbi:MAG: peptidoglycan-binding protein, partial [Coleofasciculus sp. Co-bin14]|nr:peptidoglycan-binding protein [Coleofasciculus sp. Co-bin14]
ALAHEDQADTNFTASMFAWENPKFFASLTQQKLSTSAVCSLLSLTVTLSLLGITHQALAMVKEGDRGPEVSALQQRLQQMGYFKANVTGYFGSLTKEAVIQFQQAKGLTPDGVVGKSTEAYLGGHLPSNSQAIRVPSKRAWRLGDRGEQVIAIQESLAVAGFPSSSNGIFDQATQEAVRRFQNAQGLTPDGIVGSQTMAALPAVGGSTPSSLEARVSPQSDIKALQKRLKTQGFYSGAIDGLWGPQTQAALEAAQRSYNVNANELVNGGF